MKCRVFKLKSGNAKINIPSKDYQDNIDSCPIPKEFRGLPHVIMDLKQVMMIKGAAPIECLYFLDNVCDPKKLRTDDIWNQTVMPVYLIKDKHLKSIDHDINNALDSAQPDFAKIIKLQNEKVRCESLTEKEWYTLALKKLVDQGIKPKVIKTLQDKMGIELPQEEKKTELGQAIIESLEEAVATEQKKPKNKKRKKVAKDEISNA